MPAALRDRWIRFGLLPIAALFLGLHVREVARTGVWQPPIFAAPGPDADAYPVVGGETLEVQGAGHDLQVGDRLIRIGERDLRGHGYLGFMGRAHEEVDDDGAAPLWIEREGQALETRLQMAPFTVPWVRVPFLALIWALCAYLAWRRPGDPTVQGTNVVMLAIVIGESIFEGGGLVQTTIAKLIFILGGGVWFPLLIRWIAYFPAPIPRHLPRSVRVGMLSSAVLWVGPKLMFLFGGPVPSHQIPIVMSAGDGLGVVLAFAWFGVNYRDADEAKRRSLRWVFYTTFVTGVLMVGALALPVFASDTTSYGIAIGAAGITGAIIPIGFFISMTAYDLLDIDRVISATAAYSLLLVAFLALLLSIVPGLAGAAAPTFGVDPETSRLILSVLAAALIVPAAQWLRPRIDEWFFPERSRVESGLDALLGEQAQERSPAGLSRLLARRVDDVFAPTFTATFLRKPDGFVASPPLSPVEIDRIPLDAPILRELSEETRPLVLDSRQQAGLRIGDRSAIPEPLLQADAALLLPIRQGGTIEALVIVGRKRSGDIYTGGELTLLRASLEAAHRQLDRVREQAARIEEQHRAASSDRERRKIEAAHLARSRQLAAASHDLRQPLHAMRLSAEALLEGIDHGTERATVERIHASAVSLHEMFDSLIDVARLEQGTLPVSISTFALDPLIERLAAEAEPMAEARGLALCTQGCGAAVVSDPLLLRRILQNLVVNAIRYTPEGSVTIEARRAGDRITIAVQDTGPGIPEEMHQQVFAEFVRLESSGDAHGLGLGLSIVQRLCAHLDHQVRLESRAGGGSRFSIVVPVGSTEAVAPAVDAPPAGGGIAGRRILLIDDDLTVLAAMRTLLTGWGAEVRLASDREEALAAARDVPDLILADYQLARGDRGPEVVAELRRRLGESTPAVILTGTSSPEVLAEIQAARMPCLSKPVAPIRLRAVLAASLTAR